MKKRGQVTTFIIVGILAIGAILLVFFLRNSIYEAVAGKERVNAYLEGQMDAISDEIERCVNQEGEKALRILGKQGGFFNPSHYLMLYGNKTSFLCMDIENSDKCRNTMLTETDIERQLNETLKDELFDCVDLEGFTFGNLYDYDLIYDKNSLKVDSEVQPKNVKFNISFPVKIKKGEYEISRNEFMKVVDIPMGEILSLVNGIVNAEATSGTFIMGTLNLAQKLTYSVKKRYFGSNKIYIIEPTDKDYLFIFAVEDKE